MSGTIGPISAPAASRPFLFGRQRERTWLRQALGTTLDGHGSLILVSGEAGIGKTTLVEDLAWQASERGALVLSGGCFELTTSPPYGPWLNAFGSYSSTKDLPTLPPSLQGCETGESGSPNDLFRQAQRFLETLSARVPLVLILEDLHWADQPSLDLLRDLSPAYQPRPRNADRDLARRRAQPAPSSLSPDPNSGARGGRSTP